MTPGSPVPAQIAHNPRSGLARWVAENPMAFAGLWFAASAGLLTAQGLIFLPTMVAQARTFGGTTAWQVGAVTLAYVYLSPVLLALVVGSLLGGTIVLPGLPNGWAAAVRGAAIGVISLLAWASLGAVIIVSLAGHLPPTAGEAPPGAAEVAALVLLPVPLGLAAGVGAAAGYLLHALFDGSRLRAGGDAKTGHEAGSEMEVGDENPEEW